jgi:hypothetical protein
MGLSRIDVVDRFCTIWYRRTTCHGALLDLWVSWASGMRRNGGLEEE